AAIPGNIEAEAFDQGGTDCAYHDSEPMNQGGAFRLGDAVDVESASSTPGDYDVGYIAAGEWLKYSVKVSDTGTYDPTFRVAATSKVVGAFHVEDETGKNLTGSVTVPNTGDWMKWVDVTVPSVALDAGAHVYKLVADADAWNVTAFRFAKTSSCGSDCGS